MLSCAFRFDATNRVRPHFDTCSSFDIEPVHDSRLAQASPNIFIRSAHLPIRDSFQFLLAVPEGCRNKTNSPGLTALEKVSHVRHGSAFFDT